MSRWDNLDDAIAWRDACQTALEGGLEVGTIAHGGRTAVYHSPMDLNRLCQLAQDTVNRLTRKGAGDNRRAGASLVDFN